MAMNQQVTFLSDGGDVRKSAALVELGGGILADWFHITMRVTVMKQMAIGSAAELPRPANLRGKRSVGENRASVERNRKV